MCAGTVSWGVAKESGAESGWSDDSAKIPPDPSRVPFEIIFLTDALKDFLFFFGSLMVKIQGFG